MPGCACAAAPKAPPVWPKAPVVWPNGDVFCCVAPKGDVVVDPNALGAAAGAPKRPVALLGCVEPKPPAPKAPPGVAGLPNKPPGAGAGAPNGVLAGWPKALVVVVAPKALVCCPNPPGVWGEPKAGALVWPNALVCCCGGNPPNAFVVVEAPNVGWLGVPKAPNDMVAVFAISAARAGGPGLCYLGAAR